MLWIVFDGVQLAFFGLSPARAVEIVTHFGRESTWTDRILTLPEAFVVPLMLLGNETCRRVFDVRLISMKQLEQQMIGLQCAPQPVLDQSTSVSAAMDTGSASTSVPEGVLQGGVLKGDVLVLPSILLMTWGCTVPEWSDDAPACGNSLRGSSEEARMYCDRD